MHVLTRFNAVSALAASLFASMSVAGDDDAPMFTFNGYGTLGVVHSSEDRADFTTSNVRPHGVGFSRSWSLDVDSRIAAQVNATFTPRFSAVLQVISEQNYDGTFRPHLEWANVKYQFTPDFSARVGRVSLPLFQLSESRKVGYTYPWVRPPFEIYHLNPLFTVDGLDASYRMHFGDWTHTLRAAFGKNDTDLPRNQGTFKGRDLWAISGSSEFGSLSTNIAYATTKVNLTAYDPLFDGFRQFGAQGVRIADQNDVNDKYISFIAVGADYDPGRWFVTTEWGKLSSDSVIGVRTAWYVSGGYRIRKFTPHVTYSVANTDKLSDPGLDVTMLPPFLVPPATALNAGLNSILRSQPVERTVSIGARWDFMPNVAFKLQFDHTDVGAGSTGILINTQPDFEPGGSFNLFSATIDLVF